ncbi:4Fe-4S binding protein [Candidatus Hodarchaeum mangrovi]
MLLLSLLLCNAPNSLIATFSSKNKNIALTSKFVSVHNQEQCIACGSCSKYCYFSARSFFNNQLVYQSKKCVGYGLCVTKYPIGAITMKRRKIYEN